MTRPHRRSIFNPTRLALLTCLAVILSLGAISLYGVGSEDKAKASYRAADFEGEPVVAFVGDSYTAGVGASSEDKRWTSLVSQRMGWTERNFGVKGTGYLTAVPGNHPNYAGRLDEVADSNPDIVVVAGGQNDMGSFRSNRPKVSAAIADTFNEVRSRLPKVLIIAVGPSGSGEVKPSVIDFDSVVQEAARAVNAQYVSLIAPDPVIQADRLSFEYPGHPNDVGYSAIADRVVSVLAPL